MRKIIVVLLFVLMFALPVNADEVTHVPVLMYHQLLEGPANPSKYLITPAQFERDLQKLHRHGYTTVTVNDLIAYTHGKKDLPEKPIIITFDDGYESDYVYAFPLLQKHNARACFFVIGKYADFYSNEPGKKDISYSHLNWAQIQEMHESGLAEFHSHTYDRHYSDYTRNVLKRKNESEDEYNKEIAVDFNRLNHKYYHYIGVTPTAFSCPFGLYDDQLKKAVRDCGYSAIFTSWGRVNVLTGDPEELYDLGRFCRRSDTDLDKMIAEWEEKRRG
jgi:peptidoglycan/xylan/chitin deacetylase (PgdA/CDA1 family)